MSTVATTFWIATFEHERYWDPREATVLGRLPAPAADAALSGSLALVALDDGTRLLLDDNLPAGPGAVTTARAWRVEGDLPEGAAPDLRALPFEGELWLYGDRDAAPVTPAEQREKRRKGWAF